MTAPSIDMEAIDASQLKFSAELNGIKLAGGTREYVLKVTGTAELRRKLTDLYSEQQEFILHFCVPVEKEEGEVTQWDTASFKTRLVEVKLKSGSATIRGFIDHDGVCAMSEVVSNWSEGMEFFIEGIQQKLL